VAHRKVHLPEKTCVICGRPFVWRKKWRDTWDAVTTCSERCNGERRRKARQGAPPASYR
jgi:hypothetical protein